MHRGRIQRVGEIRSSGLRVLSATTPEREPPCSRQKPLAMAGPWQGWPRRVSPWQFGTGAAMRRPANFSIRRTQRWRSSGWAFKPPDFACAGGLLLKSSGSAPALRSWSLEKVARTTEPGSAECGWVPTASKDRAGPGLSSSRIERACVGASCIAFARFMASRTLLMLDLSSSVHSLVEPLPRINGKIVQLILNRLCEQRQKSWYCTSGLKLSPTPTRTPQNRADCGSRGFHRAGRRSGWRR
jgi:hypothetical protein